jgi:hypothetical protein
VIAHDGIGAQIHCKFGTQQFDALDDPLAAVFKVKTGGRIISTQESTPYASGNAVVVRCIVN